MNKYIFALLFSFSCHSIIAMENNNSNANDMAGLIDSQEESAHISIKQEPQSAITFKTSYSFSLSNEKPTGKTNPTFNKVTIKSYHSIIIQESCWIKTDSEWNKLWYYIKIPDHNTQGWILAEKLDLVKKIANNPSERRRLAALSYSFSQLPCPPLPKEEQKSQTLLPEKSDRSSPYVLELYNYAGLIGLRDATNNNSNSTPDIIQQIKPDDSKDK